MGELIMASGFDRPTAVAGGANYLWYALGPDCDREPYGLLRNYDQPGVRAQVLSQLADMHARGMRTLSLGVSFVDGAGSGTLVDAADPVQVAQTASNLFELLGDVSDAGFERVLFRLFPQGNMSPGGAVFDPATVDDYWSMIQAMHASLAATFLPYSIDLGVEAAPADSNSILCPDKWKCPADKDWSNYVRELWRRYKQTYATTDSVGFSFITTTNRARRRVRHMRYVYEGDYPSQLAMDFYGEPGHDEADQFINMANLVHDYGADFGFAIQSFIISETWHNDPWAAAGLSSAIAATGQPVAYLTEWPLDRGAQCADVSVPPPYEYDIFGSYGY